MPSRKISTVISFELKQAYAHMLIFEQGIFISGSSGGIRMQVGESVSFYVITFWSLEMILCINALFKKTNLNKILL
jgi:hypothetical protein